MKGINQNSRVRCEKINYKGYLVYKKIPACTLLKKAFRTHYKTLYNEAFFASKVRD